MTIITGIKDATYLAQFLGKRIAIKEEDRKYGIYHLTAIYAGKTVKVLDKSGHQHYFEWDECENPYVLLGDEHIEWEQR